MTHSITRIMMACVIGLVLMLTTGCESKDIKTDVGVDVERKLLRIGTLDDLGGPGSAIGVPFASGKRILVEQINAGGSGLLPEGWQIQLIERNHNYDPNLSVKLFEEIKDKVLFIGTSYGTPNTVPLLPMLEAENMVAFPASLSSVMAEVENTPPLAPTYKLESMRAFDWAFASVGNPQNLVPCAIYQQDDYGLDSVRGWNKAAEYYGVDVASLASYTPGQKDFARQLIDFKKARCTHVLMATLPSATGPILGTAAQIGFEPVWIGNTPAWIDRFFSKEVVSPKLFSKFHWVMGTRYWGENAYQMDKVNEAFEKFGKLQGDKDFYILASYIQGRVQIEAFRRALLNKDVTRQGYLRALKSMTAYDADGLLTESINLSVFPYQAGTRTRLLKPDFDKASWREVAPFATPKAIMR